jgi:glucokinase
MSDDDERVLLADVGGTHVRFALADPGAARPLLGDTIRPYRVAEFATFTGAALAYLGETGVHATRGVFAFAGPVTGDDVCMTNHPWTLSRPRVRAELALSSLRFVNDFAAMSLAVALAEDVQPIGAPTMPPIDPSAERTFAVVGPGTGLGVGALLLRNRGAIALETEGGHAAFAPRTEEETEILRRLAARFGRVSNERLLSGPGLANLHRALGEIHGTLEAELTPEEVTAGAEAGDTGCVRAVEMFCELLGAVVGDHVLAFGAWDGAFLAGGLVQPLLGWLGRGGFRRRFEDKGRLAPMMARVPTAAMPGPHAGLLGAAVFAVLDSGRRLPPFASVERRRGRAW